MHPAVDGMIDEYRSAFYAFLGGLLCFHAMAALAGWVHFHHLAKKDDDGVHAWEYYWLSSLLSFSSPSRSSTWCARSAGSRSRRHIPRGQPRDGEV